MEYRKVSPPGDIFLARLSLDKESPPGTARRVLLQTTQGGHFFWLGWERGGGGTSQVVGGTLYDTPLYTTAFQDIIRVRC